MDLAALGILIGLANGALLLVKPVYRIHWRIDRNADDISRLKERLQALEDALSVPFDKSE